MSDVKLQVRAAVKEDMVAVREMIQELAAFENQPDAPKLSVEELQHDGFERSPPAFGCKVAEVRDGDERALAGYALYFPTYSTWGGRSLLLEDLYVRPAMRRLGVGSKLFQAVAKEAHSTGCCRVDFHVLEWNPARAFYERRGAADLTAAEAWCLYRLSGAALASEANKD